MNRIKQLFKNKKCNVLNVYFTAGHPNLHDTGEIIKSLEQCGVDLIEIGMPYSDPLADGETIQKSSQIALQNGMNLSLLFTQISDARQYSDIPIILMGYYNQMVQYGEERFLSTVHDAGVDGLIIPDLPMDVYEKSYKALFDKYDMAMSFLITPETSDTRVRQADRLSEGFLYVVSKSSITGSSSQISNHQKAYFNHIDSLDLMTPRLIGFGIHNKDTYNVACQYANGAIIGSAFIRALEGEKEQIKISNDTSLNDRIKDFIAEIR